MEIRVIETAKEYLDKTESAVKALFQGIDGYKKILENVNLLIFHCHYTTDKDFKERYSNWQQENKTGIDQYAKAQAEYIDEIFAQSVLCGSIVQIAAMAIKKYSPTQQIPSEWEQVGNIGSATKYFIGRTVREIPIGLLIYATRNQHNHYDDETIREPASTIFQRLSTIESSPHSEAKFIDPAFDLQNVNVIHYASNTTALMKWRSYDRYIADMEDMLLRK